MEREQIVESRLEARSLGNRAIENAIAAKKELTATRLGSGIIRRVGLIRSEDRGDGISRYRFDREVITS